jgi:hypothetical protein
VGLTGALTKSLDGRYVATLLSRLFPLRIAQASGQTGKSGHVRAFILVRIRNAYRRQRPTALAGRTACSTLTEGERDGNLWW